MVSRSPSSLATVRLMPSIGDRSLEDHVLLQVLGDIAQQPEVVGVGNWLEGDEARSTVDVSLHHVAAHAAIGLERQFEIDLRTLGDARERSQSPGFRSQIGAKRLRLDVERGQADAADRDAVAFVQAPWRYWEREW